MNRLELKNTLSIINNILLNILCTLLVLLYMHFCWIAPKREIAGLEGLLCFALVD